MVSYPLQQCQWDLRTDPERHPAGQTFDQCESPALLKRLQHAVLLLTTVVFSRCLVTCLAGMLSGVDPRSWRRGEGPAHGVPSLCCSSLAYLLNVGRPHPHPTWGTPGTPPGSSLRKSCAQAFSGSPRQGSGVGMGDSRQGFSCCLLLEREAHSFISTLEGQPPEQPPDPCWCVGCLLLTAGLHTRTSMQRLAVAQGCSATKRD